MLFTLFLLAGCNSFTSKKYEPEKKPEEYSTGIKILENNKEQLTAIKNKTADDIDLGNKIRKLEKKHSDDAELGEHVRNAIREQQPIEMKKDRKETVLVNITETADVNTRLNVLIIIILLFNVIEVSFLSFNFMRWRKTHE